MKPYANVQPILIFNPDKNRYEFGGSTFRMSLSAKHYFTAAHCVKDIKPSDIKIMNCLDDDTDIGITSMHVHPEADFAILEIASKPPERFGEFELAKKDFSYGPQIHCFGFLGEFDKKKAPGRVIGGIIQRDFKHCNDGYENLALEYSAPIPKGMSGGPAFYAVDDKIVIGMAIGTIQSEVVLSQYVEYETQDRFEKEKISEFVRYGVILRLFPYTDWINKIISL